MQGLQAVHLLLFSFSEHQGCRENFRLPLFFLSPALSAISMPLGEGKQEYPIQTFSSPLEIASCHDGRMVKDAKLKLSFF